jgi:hypothetical protein
MAWLKLCPGDPLVETLTDVFEANLVRVPEERIRPLGVVAHRNGKSSFRGALAPLLSGSADALAGLALQQSRMADLSGKRSRKVSLDLGLEVLDGFLRGFGLSGGAALREQFEGADQVSFSFREVNRVYLDAGELGRLLKGRRLDPANPAVAIFMDRDDPYDFLLIDSAITSREFSIQVERAKTSDFKLDVPAIQDLIAKAKANVSVESSSSFGLSFAGPQALSFAFTCLQFLLDDQGRILSLPPYTGAPLSFTRSADTASNRVLLSTGPGLLEWEN